MATNVPLCKKTLIPCIAACIVIIILQYAATLKSTLQPLLSSANETKLQAADKASIVARNAYAIADLLKASNSSLFHPGLLKDVRDRLSIEHSEMQRITRDLRKFLTASFQQAVGGKRKDKASAVLIKSMEFLSVFDLKLEATSALTGVKETADSALRKLHELVQKTLHNYQHPLDCNKAPKLLCKLTSPWGFGSGMHDVLWCFVAALQLGRTVILDSTRWHYTPGENWTKTFQPVAGRACENVSLAQALSGYPGGSYGPEERGKILDMPSAIVGPLVANHGEPYAWWYGQCMAYILRLQNSTRRKIDEFKEKHDFKSPVVGIHIRRSDKRSEAAYHNKEQYMSYAEDFYMKLSLTAAVPKKRVFVATDCPEAIAQLKERFTDYTFITDKRSATVAERKKARSKKTALFDIVRDIYLLAESDVIVCAFSSGFCRVAYELMQSLHADASNRAISVDIDYFYAVVPFPPRRAIYGHQGRHSSELNFTAGQLIEDPLHPYVKGKATTFPNGYQQGRVVGTHKKGLYPTYKTCQTYRAVEYRAFTSHSESG